MLLLLTRQCRASVRYSLDHLSLGSCGLGSCAGCVEGVITHLRRPSTPEPPSARLSEARRSDQHLRTPGTPGRVLASVCQITARGGCVCVCERERAGVGRCQHHRRHHHRPLNSVPHPAQVFNEGRFRASVHRRPLRWSRGRPPSARRQRSASRHRGARPPHHRHHLSHLLRTRTTCRCHAFRRQPQPLHQHSFRSRSASPRLHKWSRLSL